MIFERGNKRGSFVCFRGVWRAFRLRFREGYLGKVLFCFLWGGDDVESRGDLGS